MHGNTHISRQAQSVAAVIIVLITILVLIHIIIIVISIGVTPVPASKFENLLMKPAHAKTYVLSTIRTLGK